jgi:hypothetical protein
VKKPPGGVDCSSFTNLKAAVRASWPKDWGVPGSAIDHVRVAYKDVEGDDITVERDEELQAAIREDIKKFCVALPGASGEATPLSVHALPMCIVWVGSRWVASGMGVGRRACLDLWTRLICATWVLCLAGEGWGHLLRPRERALCVTTSPTIWRVLCGWMQWLPLGSC